MAFTGWLSKLWMPNNKFVLIPVNLNMVGVTNKKLKKN